MRYQPDLRKARATIHIRNPLLLATYNFDGPCLVRPDEPQQGKPQHVRLYDRQQ